MPEYRGAKCPTCKKRYSSKANLNRHINDIHLQVKKFDCQACELTFPQKIHRDKHTLAIHNLEPPPRMDNVDVRPHDIHYVAGRTCNVCQKVFSLKTNMIRHRKVHWNDPVNHWPNGSFKRAARKSIAEVAHAEASDETNSIGRNNDRADCDICWKTFRFRFEMLRHKQKRHGVSTYTGKSTMDAEKVEIGTLQILESEQGYTVVNAVQCTEINQGRNGFASEAMSSGDTENEGTATDVTQRRQLEGSIISNSGHSFKQKTCDMSDERFPTHATMESHRMQHLSVVPNTETDSDDQDGEVLPGTSSCKCRFCSQLFPVKQDLYVHIQHKHQAQSRMCFSKYKNKMVVRSSRAAAQRTCDICSKVFKYRKIMLKHRQRHVQNTEIPQTDVGNDATENGGHGGSTDITQSDMLSILDKEKIQEMQRESSSTRCTICHRNFVDRRVILRHIDTVHLKLRPFQCTNCEASFSHRYVLDSHSLRIHGFRRPRSRKKRRPTKQTDAPADGKCDICGRVYSTRTNMLRHRKGHHVDYREDLSPSVSDANNNGRDYQEDCQVKIENRKIEEIEEQKQFKIKNKIQQSMENPISSRDGFKFKCNKCSKLFLSRILMAKHVYSYHVLKRRYKCELCRTSFRLRSQLENHERLAHNTNAISEQDLNPAIVKTESAIETEHGVGRKEFKINGEHTQKAIQKLTILLKPKRAKSTDSEGMAHVEKPPKEVSASHSPNTPSRSGAFITKLMRKKGNWTAVTPEGCNTCNTWGTSFIDKLELQEHMQVPSRNQVHSRNRQNIIRITRDSRDSTGNDDTSTNGNYSYSCPSCKGAFSDSMQLISHIRLHMKSGRCQ